MNAALTVLLASMLTVHRPAAPVQALPQPVKAEPGDAAAPRVTMLPLSTLLAQSEPQLIVDESLDTVPAPVPSFVTVSRRLGLATVTATGADVVTFPARSRATAVRVWGPSGLAAVFQETE